MIKSTRNLHSFVVYWGLCAGALTSALLVSACAEKYGDSLEQACFENKPEDRRVLLMDGVSGAAVQTECMPHTKAPLPPKRFEGR